MPDPGTFQRRRGQLFAYVMSRTVDANRPHPKLLSLQRVRTEEVGKRTMPAEGVAHSYQLATVPSAVDETVGSLTDVRPET